MCNLPGSFELPGRFKPKCVLLAFSISDDYGKFGASEIRI
jgi:hypothetical protein